MEYKTEKSIFTAPSRNGTMNYDYFMIFELLDSGERQRFNITEDEFRSNLGAGILHPRQVAIIVKEDFRRIFIWKGSAPHVRKKFIASRVAQELQQEMVQIGHLHRCKVVTVEQGDETNEFLRVFGFNLEELAKATGFTGEVLPDVPKVTKQPPTTSPIIEKNLLASKSRPNIIKKSPKIEAREDSKLKKELPKETLDKILNLELPQNFKRKNILTGQNTLYGIITKKIEIFGQNVEEKAWEPISNLPSEVFELDGHKLRIHYNNTLNTIDAIEILEPILELKKEISILNKELNREIDYNKWTVKELKAYCLKNDIKVPSSYRKAQIVQLVKDHST